MEERYIYSTIYNKNQGINTKKANMFNADSKKFREVLSGKNKESGIGGSSSSWGGSFAVYMEAKNKKL